VQLYVFQKVWKIALSNICFEFFKYSIFNTHHSS
jgi:hypothetical protein